jgi:hypothetical protein
MNEETPPQGDREGESGNPPVWRIDEVASRRRLRDIFAGKTPAHGDGGKLIYTDEQGRQRRLPEDMSSLSTAEIMAVARATSQHLGAAPPGDARIAALERLNEMRASGMVSEENYLREKRRLLGLD